MKSEQPQNIPVIQRNDPKCLSCGALLPDRRRKYCSQDCRYKLGDCLNRRTGLLKALNTRYATFYFNEFIIVMDVLPYGTEQIFSFMLPRVQGNKPREDFRQLSNLLGNFWWAEAERTKKRYKASEHLLDKARKSDDPAESVIPFDRVYPSIGGISLVALQLKRSDLRGPRLKEILKRAYRRQAKKHHPDLGGDSDTFRKLQDAYEYLLNWSRNPSYVRRRGGFPDKWLYEGESNRWIQPTARKF